MTERDCLNKIEKLNYALTVEDLLCGSLDPDLRDCLKVLAICNDGTGRSLTVAQTLTSKHEIPAMYFRGGLSLLSDPELDQQRTCLISTINTFPFVVTTLVPREVSHYANLLSQIRKYQFKDSSSAISGMLKHLKSK